MRSALLAALLAASAPAVAQSPAPAVAVDPARLAKAEEMMRVMRIEETTNKVLDAVIGQSMSRATDQALAALPDSELKNDPEFRGILKRNLDRISAATTAQMRAAMPELIREMTAIYARNFSEAELDDMIRFYSSPTGQSFIEKMPAVSQQSVAVTQTLLLPKVMALIPPLTQQMTQEIAAWAKNRKPAVKS